MLFRIPRAPSLCIGSVFSLVQTGINTEALPVISFSVSEDSKAYLLSPAKHLHLPGYTPVRPTSQNSSSFSVSFLYVFSFPIHDFLPSLVVFPLLSFLILSLSNQPALLNLTTYYLHLCLSIYLLILFNQLINLYLAAHLFTFRLAYISYYRTNKPVKLSFSCQPT